MNQHLERPFEEVYREVMVQPEPDEVTRLKDEISQLKDEILILGARDVMLTNRVAADSHTCGICEHPAYQQAVAIIKRSGLKEETWGYLLHDMVKSLIEGPTATAFRLD